MDPLYNTIKSFVEKSGCVLVGISSRKTNTNRNHRVVNFNCKCGKYDEKTWINFKKHPNCLSCSSSAGKILIDLNVIKTFVESHNGIFVSAAQVKMDKIRLMVTYICTCKYNDGRETVQDWYNIKKKGCNCDNCTMERRKLTCLDKYGTEYVTQAQPIRTKIIETNMQNCGFECALSSPYVREKSKQTMIKKYGTENPIQNEQIRERIRQTLLDRYGVPYTFMSEQIKEKSRQTSIDNYGVNHPMQNAEVFSRQLRSLSSKKEYKFPDGTIIKCRGYEPFAYDIFISQGLKKEDILNDSDITECGVFSAFMYDFNGKQHRYYPDFYIEPWNKFIEVKSTYTLELDKDVIDLKLQSVKKYNYEIELWVFDADGKRVN